MADTRLIGYARLVERHALPALPLPAIAAIATTQRIRTVTRRRADQELQQFPPRYEPEDTPLGDLQFALRYEGVNLQVLASLFEKRGGEDVQALVDASPQSSYARRLGYLYEWITGETLRYVTPQRASYIELLDGKLQYCLGSGTRTAKFRVIDNLPGNRNFCPLVRRTQQLEAILGQNLAEQAQSTLAKYDHVLLQRAASFLYLKETQSSFEVERETPSPQRSWRFADLLREAENGTPLSEDRFVELQNAVVDPRFREASYRTEQNWIGDDLGYRKRVAFVPPRPNDARELMDGLVTMSASFHSNPANFNPVIAAACLSFGFVFTHPFMDGNGRLHRYLIHEALSTAGFTPKGIILPVSAVILAHLGEYIAALEAFSKPLGARTTWNPDTPDIPPSGNDALYFRYFDATAQAEFLAWALQRTIERDLNDEIAFLLAFDRARRLLNAEVDWPGHSLDLFVRVVHQNGYKLSKNKRDAHFSWLTDDEERRFADLVRKSFESDNE
jgi:Fic family protein